MIDQRKLIQILLNLLSNAVKFTPAGGRVTVQASIVAATGEVQISVIDTGIGMRAEDIPIALAPFGQIDSSLAREYEGTGLGLTLVQRFTELLGGTMSIESQAGNGTVITLLFPHAMTVGAEAA